MNKSTLFFGIFVNNETDMQRKRRNYILIYLLILILLISPSLAFYGTEKLPLDFLSAILIQGAIFSLPFVLFYRFPRLYFLLLLPIVLLAPFSLIPPVFFGLEVNTDILNLVRNTTFREARELFGSIAVYFIIFFLLYVFLYLFLVKKSPGKIKFYTGFLVSAAGLTVLILMTLLRSGTKDFTGGIKSSLVLYYPTNTVYSVVKNFSKIKKVDHAKLVENFTFGAVKKDSLAERQIYVLVIGETSRYANWGINGYHRNTTPLLGKRDDFLNFSDATTGASMTEQSVPIIITRASPDDLERHYREKTVEEAFRESGFKTYWITDQADFMNIRMHTDEIKNVISVGSSYSKRSTVHDILIVDELSRVLQSNPDSNLFIILHTMGSHFNYSSRYPDEFDVFRPSGGGKSFNPLLRQNKEIMVNSYDNSILYTDYILDSIMNTLENQRTVSYMLYLSDHGEDLFDDEREKSLHAFSEPSRFVAHIPFLIWTSSLYDSVYAEKFDILKQNQDKPISSDNVFETLLDMANITYRDVDSSKSIANPSFTDSEQKLLGGELKLFKYKDLK